MDRASQEKYDVSEPTVATVRATGTTVRIQDIDKGQKTLDSEAVAQYLTQHLALYLNRYPVATYLDGRPLDARSCIRHITTYSLEDHHSLLDVVEWTFETRTKDLLICDPEGFVWHEMPAGIQARGIFFTAFLRCPQARFWYESGEYLLGELSPAVAIVVKVAKEKLREYVRERLARDAREIVTEWKKEKIYPYAEADDSSPVEVAERQVFDIVASQVHLHHEAFRHSPREVRQLTLQLTRLRLRPPSCM